MFCPKCGNELPDDATFCGKCGNQLAAKAKPAQAGPARTTHIATGSALAGVAADSRLPLGQLILSIVAAITLFLPWEVATVVTQGEISANLFDTLQLVAYNLTHNDNVAVPMIFMLVCLVIGMLLMVIGSAMGVVTKKPNAGAKASLIGAVVVAILALVILTSGSSSSNETLLSYAYSTSMTMAPWICLIAAVGVGVISFLRK